MKKKKIVFSSSGGKPAMLFLRHITECFGTDEICHIAKMIAMACRETNFHVSAMLCEEGIELKGTPPACVEYDGGTIAITAANTRVENTTLIID
ncbi:MAG: hypothetical protein IJF06_02210 [Bacteroidaceae bacterium]|nr:hypothetical protein [Bacteroidaceae bacterium]